MLDPKNKDYTEIKSCRLCRSDKLITVVDLGKQYIQHSFVHPLKNIGRSKKYPTHLVGCLDCGLLQLKQTVSRNILYSVYWYRSGTNNTMKKHLKVMVKEIMEVVKIKKPKILDIGCNDGTMLQMFPKNSLKIGIDPSDISQGELSDFKLISDFFPSTKLAGMKFDVVASIAMYYDVDDPVRFAKEVKKLLTQNGVWVLEVAYLPTMIKNNSYDTICHEHLLYFHLKVLEKIASTAGLKIVKADLNNINGGSIRCYLALKSSNKYNNILSGLPQIHKEEKKTALDNQKIYSNFKKNIAKSKNSLLKLLKKLKKENQIIHIYGASTKGNTILQYCGIGRDLIQFAADKNPEKWGAKTPGAEIKIISEKESRQKNPDYYLVLPWSFKKEFLIRERKLLEKGTRMIFPLPNVEVIPKK